MQIEFASTPVIPSDCTYWHVGSPGPTPPAAQFADGVTLRASGVHPYATTGERAAALMECFAGKRPWLEHLDEAAAIVHQLHWVGSYRPDGGADDQGGSSELLADLLDGEVTSDSSGRHSIDGDATGRALVKKLYTGLSSRSVALRECVAVYAKLRADSRAHALHRTPLWALVPGLVLLAGLRLMLFSGELGASMVSITNLSDPAAGTIRMGINLLHSEGLSEVEIDAMTDEFMRRPDLQKWFLGYYVQCAKVLANGPALLASLLDDYPDLAAHLKGSAVAD